MRATQVSVAGRYGSSIWDPCLKTYEKSPISNKLRHVQRRWDKSFRQKTLTQKCNLSKLFKNHSILFFNIEKHILNIFKVHQISTQRNNGSLGKQVKSGHLFYTILKICLDNSGKQMLIQYLWLNLNSKCFTSSIKETLSRPNTKSWGKNWNYKV